MIESFLTFLRASAMFVVGYWILGYIGSKLSRDVVRLPAILALLCGYPRKDGYVNCEAAGLQLAAVIIPFVGTLVVYFGGIGKPTLIISLAVLIGTPTLMTWLLRATVR